MSFFQMDEFSIEDEGNSIFVVLLALVNKNYLHQLNLICWLNVQCWLSSELEIITFLSLHPMRFHNYIPIKENLE